MNVDYIPVTECFNIGTGKLNSNAAVDGGEYPFFTCSKEASSIDKYAFDQEALLLAGNNAQGQYDVKYYNGKFNAYQRTYVLSLKSDSHSYSYFKYALQAQLELLKASSKGTNTKYITMEILGRVLLPVPCPSEQQRIAAILDKADAIRQKRKQAIDLADEFLRSVFLDMFGDPVANPKGFSVKVLSQLYIDPKNGTKCGPFGSALKKEEFVDEGIPVWNMDNISLSGNFKDEPKLWVTEEKFNEIDAYSVIDGDVIISRAGTVGKMGVVRTKYSRSLISTNLIRVRFSEDLLPEFFVALMTYCKGRVGRLKTGPDGSFTHMNTGILDKLEFPYPPVELQRKFLKLLADTEKYLDKMPPSQWNDLFNSLSQKAFSGQL
ncbi:restriction endonuclease subunit S [Vibrio vulnificus]|nr:restriction endonuclease subunit S [Vibrio vulnificus]